MEEYVNHIQGSKGNYSPSEMQGGIYFSKDTKEILLNGDSYGNSVKADEEDITLGEGSLKLKDRAYDVGNFSGKGYKILRKNIAEGSSILTLDMINEPNTVYEIRYDFNLNGLTITIPKECILDFRGGSLINGIIIGNNTIVKSNNKCLFSNVKLQGYFSGEGFSSYFQNISDNDLFYSLIRFEIATFDNINKLTLTSGSSGYDIKNRGIILRSSSILYIECAFGLDLTLLNLACESDTVGLFYYLFKNINIRFTLLNFDDIPDLSALNRYFLINIATYTTNSVEHKVILDIDNCDIESWSVPFRVTLYNNTDFEFHINNSNLKSADFCTEFYWDRVTIENRLCTGDCTITNSNINSTHSGALSIGTNMQQKLLLRDSIFVGRIESNFSYVTATLCLFKNTDKTEKVRINFGGINLNLESDTYAPDSYLNLSNCIINSTIYLKYSHFTSIRFSYCTFEGTGGIYLEKCKVGVCENSYIRNKNTENIYKFLANNLLSAPELLLIINNTFKFDNKILLFPDYVLENNNTFIVPNEYPESYINYYKSGKIITPLGQIFELGRLYNYLDGNWMDSRGRIKDSRVSGNTSQRPSTNLIMSNYYDTLIRKPIWWDGTKWITAEGLDADSTGWAIIE